MARKDELGRRGEAIAAAHLAERGFRILDRNWRSARGEIDIVALEGDRVVIVEVKTRSSLAFGHPFEAIHPTKLERLYRLGWDWCRAHGMRRPMRVDAIGIVLAGPAAPVIEHLVGVR